MRKPKENIDPYASGFCDSTTLSIKRFNHIQGLNDVENGLFAMAAFDLTIKAFLKCSSLFQSVDVVNLSKISLGNCMMRSEYLS